LSLSVLGLTKAYRRARRPPVLALDDLDISAGDGELLVVVGPSGSGKTTLLRCIAGLEDADTGTIEVAGDLVADRSPGDRNVAMVFQDYALYPHLSVGANISFPLRAAKMPDAERTTAVHHAAELLELTDKIDRYPGELSGGEQQRVALARAIVRRPRLFLMDEPLSNLDAELRVQTRAEIRSLQDRLGITTLYVTHDQVEAMTMGDKVAVLRSGRVEQVGTPRAVYERPATTFVAGFFGGPPMNLVPVGLIGSRSNAATTYGIRAEKLRFAPVDSAKLSGRVSAVEFTGGEVLVRTDVEGHELIARTAPDAAPKPGDQIGLDYADSDLFAFDAAGKIL
jgi:ABC-type sugar transport system ATPase subunit